MEHDFSGKCPLHVFPRRATDSLKPFAILAYQWFIARVGLEISPAGAGGIVILDLIISLIIEEYTSRLLLGHGMLG